MWDTECTHIQNKLSIFLAIFTHIYIYICIYGIYGRENNHRCFLPFVNGFEMNGGQCRHVDEARDETLSQDSMPTPTTATSSTCIKNDDDEASPQHDNPLTYVQYVYVFILCAHIK